MKIFAVICEYNPFHFGHLKQLDETKKALGCDACIALMSGDYVQRGEIAVYDKRVRASAAAACGADLVLMLPTPYSLSSAEFFASGAVKILNRLNLVDYLSFGSECGETAPLTAAANKLLSERTQEKIGQNMKKGIPIFKAMSEALGTDLLCTPNNILGTEYIKALIKTGSKIEPFTLKRENNYHDKSISAEYPSASAIRRILSNRELFEKCVPSPAFEIYKNAQPRDEKALEKAIIYSLRAKDAACLTEYADVSEGLENLIKRSADKFNTLEEIIMAVKSKRYSYTRIRRIIYNIFLDIKKESRALEPQYVKFLAFNETGRKILRELKKKSGIPVIGNIKKEMFSSYDFLKIEYKTDKITECFYKNNC